jgi:hypothetical protein
VITLPKPPPPCSLCGALHCPCIHRIAECARCLAGDDAMEEDQIPKQEIPRELTEKPELGAPPPAPTKESVLQKMQDEFKVAEGQPLEVVFDAFQAFQLAGCLQLAWRHPRLNPDQKNLLRWFGDRIISSIRETCPSAAQVADMGWKITEDVPINPCPHCIREQQTRGLVVCKYHHGDVRGSRIIRPGG